MITEVLNDVIMSYSHVLRAANFEQTELDRNSDIRLPASNQCRIEQYPASGRASSGYSTASHPASAAYSNDNENLESCHRFDIIMFLLFLI